MPRYSARFLAAPRPTLYARRTKGGVVDMFLDKEATELTTWYSLGDPKRPRHGRKWFTLRNFRYKLEWLPDTPPETPPDTPPETPLDTYAKIGPGHPAYERVKEIKAMGGEICDSLDHNEDTGCSNPNCFKAR